MHRATAHLSVTMAAMLLMAGCSTPVEPDASPAPDPEVEAALAPDAGEVWEPVAVPIPDDSRITGIAEGAGRLWITVQVDAPESSVGLQVWSSADAVTWEEVDLIGAGMPVRALCLPGREPECVTPSASMSGDESTFTLGVFVAEDTLTALGIAFTPRVIGAEWVLRFDGDDWSSHSPAENGLLARSAAEGYWDGTGPAVDSASFEGATLFVAKGGWYQERRTSGEAFHARLLDASGQGSVIHGDREPFAGGDEFRQAKVVTHTGKQWVVVGELGAGLQGLGVWQSPDAVEWALTRVPPPVGGGNYQVQSIASGDDVTVVGAFVNPDGGAGSTEQSPFDQTTAVVLRSTDNSAFEVIALPVPDDGEDYRALRTNVTWQVDRFFAVGTFMRVTRLWQSFDGRDWSLIEMEDPYRTPEDDVLRWGDGLVAHSRSIVIVSGIEVD